MFVCLASAEFPRKTSVVRNMALVSGYQRFASSAPGSKVTLFVPVGSNITEICGTESAYRSIDNAPEGKKKTNSASRHGCTQKLYYYLYWSKIIRNMLYAVIFKWDNRTYVSGLVSIALFFLFRCCFLPVDSRGTSSPLPVSGQDSIWSAPLLTTTC